MGRGVPAGPTVGWREVGWGPGRGPGGGGEGSVTPVRLGWAGCKEVLGLGLPLSRLTLPVWLYLM